MNERTVTVDGIAVTDFGGAGRPMVALHGSFGRASIFDGLARELAGRARIVAPDQRGHGYTGRADSYASDDFVGDAAGVIERLGLAPVVVFGHSHGGITAYRLAARHPELVSALVIEDVGPVMRPPEIARPILDVRGWPAEASTKNQLAEAIRSRGVPDPGYFMQSAEPADGGWRLLFDWDDMMAVQAGGVGDWWEEWLGSTCPALVLRGEHSTLLPAELAARMIARRPGSRLVEFAGAGHWIHDDDPAGVARAVAGFLGELGLSPGRSA
ncbi:alpha/beta fold hydrolase [Nocardia sp. BMG51109]|uniref:alpha/beta fold hydrolase n=1 Tax=Nocardia sp. BMG51109 TaxID=1056816 RepID=UPI0004642258|nr:alpha/beta hydrolase [Nocardia sp. BMG51109]